MIAKSNMIRNQLINNYILEKYIIELYNTIPRCEFVPKHFKKFAYSDIQISLKYGQYMLSPLEEGKILQSLSLKGHENILEIGTGTGFFTALLSNLCKKVISIDYFSYFTQYAINKINKYNLKNIHFITGDASNGWKQHAPYDVIIYTGSIESITSEHKSQIVHGGKIFAIVNRKPIMQGIIYNIKNYKIWKKQTILETSIPLIINAKLYSNNKKKFVF